VPSTFPASTAGHGKQDERETLVVGVAFHRLFPKASAFPSIAIWEGDGYEIRVASNGRYAYWWNGKELLALDLASVTRYAANMNRKSLDKSTKRLTPAIPATPPTRRIVMKRRS